MEVLDSLDPDSKLWVMEHWNDPSYREAFENLLREHSAPEPVIVGDAIRSHERYDEDAPLMDDTEESVEEPPHKTHRRE
jgi:hypothetical protein